MRRLVLAVLGTLSVAALAGQQPAAAPKPTPSGPKVDPRRPPEPELETSIGDGFTLAAVGDLIISRPLTQTLPNDPGFEAVVRLLRGADATFGNFENVAADPSRPADGLYPYPGPSDVALVAEP